MKPIPSNAASEYLRQGFVVLPQILDDEELAVLERSCDTLLAEPPDDDMGGKAHNIGKGHDRRYGVDPSSAARAIGWSPRQSFEEALRQTVQWYLETLPADLKDSDDRLGLARA